MKIAFYTLGCKVNQYETQALKEQFSGLGWDIVGEEDQADVYVVNTCTVTNLADRKSRQYIRRMKRQNPASITAVIGCYVQANPEEAQSLQGVDLVVGTNEKTRLPEYVLDVIEQKRPSVHIRSYEDLSDYEEAGAITSMETRTRAYIKVQEGCNQFCSYCIIPYARGGIRSRSKEEIVKEAESLVARGFKELVLTGINTALYGMDRGKPASDQIYGIEVIVDLINQIPGDFRIRLGSLEPTVINADYVQRLLKYNKLCPHMHLSLQSGSDRILREMNRHYDREGYRAIVKILREADPCYGLTTDIIVGFPGETEADLDDTMDMIREIGFQKVHIFPYSRRQGTRAADMNDQISQTEKKLRCVRLNEVALHTSRKMLEANTGAVRNVLFEEYNPNTGYINGYSDNYIKVYCKVSGGKEAEELLNRFVLVTLDKPHLEGVEGIVCVEA